MDKDYSFLLGLPLDLSKAYIKKMSNSELKECVKQFEKMKSEDNKDI